VNLWHVAYNPRIRGLTHRATAGFGHSLLAPLASSVFETLRISASVFEHGEEWVLLHGERSVLAFEYEHGKDHARAVYNGRCLERVVRTKKPVRGEHGRYVDLFVPIIAKKKIVGVLVVGPFALRRPTAVDVLGRWKSLTRREGHPADPDFGAYLAAALSVLVLEGKRSVIFERLLGCLATLMGGEGAADALMNEIEGLRAELMPTREADRARDIVAEIVDHSSLRSPHSGPRQNDLRDLGLTRPTDHVLVGLTVNSAADPDPVDEVIRRDALQRESFEVGRRIGDALAGRVGDHGVVVLCASSGSAQKKRQKVRDLSEKVALIAHRFGLTMHFGASPWSESDPLSRSYQAALAAAESALMAGTRIEIGEPGAHRTRRSLRHLREELGKIIEERPALLGARFDRYLEAVAAEYRYRIEPARAHLEIAFERAAETLLRTGALDDKGFRALLEDLDRSAEEARTVTELFVAYRRAVADLSSAAQRPARARQERHLRSAIEYIHQHYREPLGRTKVAKVAGFAPGYFSLLFKQRERKTFEEYVQTLRIERARQLLESTRIDAARIAELSGFATAQYFSRAFRRAMGVTPLEHRTKALRAAVRANGGRRGMTKR
jgi:AraC-like DNA-binding protein